MLKLIKYHPQFAYSVGDVFEVNEADTMHLLENGFAEETADAPPAPETGDVPPETGEAHGAPETGASTPPETADAPPAPETAGRKGGKK